MIFLFACTWVSKTEVDARLATVDDDGDGYLVGDDCNDAAAAIHPDAAEAWYDGIDQDCDGADDFDQDGDGAPLDTDCDDTDAAVSPAATEVPYDGVDNDCAGGDLTDVDGDGHALGDDCDDADATVYPGAEDPSYDGVDSDCAGDDDFDQDGDGVDVDTDCDDTDPAIHPGAADTPYDGVDSDCAGDDDFDRDLDGEADPSGGGEDCDDADAAVFPGALETIGDSLDADCDGEPDGFRLRELPDITWTAAAGPTLVAGTDGVVLSVVAEAVTTPSGSWYDSALLFAVTPSDTALDVAEADGWVTNASDPSSYTVGGAAGYRRDGDVSYGVLPLETSSGRSLLFATWDPDAGARATVNVASSAAFGPFDDVSEYVDPATGQRSALGCERTDGVLAWARVDSADAVVAAASLELPGVASLVCSFDDAGALWAAPGGALTRYDLSEDADGWHATGVRVLDGVHAVDLDAFPGGLVGVDGDSAAIFVFDGTGAAEIPSRVSFERVDALADGSGAVAVASDAAARWVEPDGTTTVLPAPFAVEDAAAVEAGGYRIVVATGATGVAIGYARLP